MNRVLIVEDDMLLGDQLRQHLLSLSEISYVDHVNTLKEAILNIEKNTYQLFVMDLELPDGSGHDFINYIRRLKEYEMTYVVIITGTREATHQIIQSYNHSKCQLYFQKPFSIQEFKKQIRHLFEYRRVKSESERLVIKRKQVNLFFELNDILYIEINNKDTTVFCTNGDFSIGRYPLSKLETELPSKRFLRIHRGYIVNRDHIRHLEKRSGFVIVHINGKEEGIPVGTSYKGIVDDIC